MDPAADAPGRASKSLANRGESRADPGPADPVADGESVLAADAADATPDAKPDAKPDATSDAKPDAVTELVAPAAADAAPASAAGPPAPPPRTHATAAISTSSPGRSFPRAGEREIHGGAGSVALALTSTH